MLFALLLAFGVSGCIGADGQRAEALLQQAQNAQASITSEKFVMRFDIEAEGKQISMSMDGGAYLKGPHRGDFYFTMSGSGVPQMSALNMSIVRRGNIAEVRAAGRTQRVSAPAEQSQFGSPTSMLQLARYVKSVSVDETAYNGRPADRIVGKLDTNALLGSAGGFATKALGSSGVHLGDIRAVLFVPRDTHLVEVMFADLDIKADGHKAHLHISIASRDINKPVSIPEL